MYKSELARLAGVSPRTFQRYMVSRHHVFEKMGVSHRAHLLPPQAVKYICDDYGIEI